MAETVVAKGSSAARATVNVAAASAKAVRVAASEEAPEVASEVGSNFEARSKEQGAREYQRHSYPLAPCPLLLAPNIPNKQRKRSKVLPLWTFFRKFAFANKQL